MPKFRKKPVTIDAWQNVEGSPIPDWLQGRGDGEAGGVLFIITLEGIMRGEPGDWIIQGVKGEVYPCKPDIFTATYEAAEPEKDREAALYGGHAALWRSDYGPTGGL